MRPCLDAAKTALAKLEQEESGKPAVEEPRAGHKIVAKFAESVQRYSEMSVADQLLAIMTKHKERPRPSLARAAAPCLNVARRDVCNASSRAFSS